ASGGGLSGNRSESKRASENSTRSRPPSSTAGLGLGCSVLLRGPNRRASIGSASSSPRSVAGSSPPLDSPSSSPCSIAGGGGGGRRELGFAAVVGSPAGGKRSVFSNCSLRGGGSSAALGRAEDAPIAASSSDARSVCSCQSVGTSRPRSKSPSSALKTALQRP